MTQSNESLRPRVLTIIVSYNFEPWIERCLGSLEESGYPTDVVVVDNASTDRTVEILVEQYRWIRLVRSTKNLGFGRANNIGMKLALEGNYDYVFLLNEDAWIARDTIGTLVKAAQQNPDYGVLSPVHLNGKGEQLDTAFAHYIGGDVPATSGESSLVEIPFVNAAFWLIPVTVLRRVGGFSPLYYHYGEDVDYIHRIQYHGYRVGYTPQTKGCHDRQDRPTPRAMQMKLDRVYFLSVFSDVRAGFAKRLWGGVLAPWKPALLGLLRGHFGEFRFYAATSWQLLRRCGCIAQVREDCKRGIPVFLESVHSKITPIWS